MVFVLRATNRTAAVTELRRRPAEMFLRALENSADSTLARLLGEGDPLLPRRGGDGGGGDDGVTLARSPSRGRILARSIGASVANGVSGTSGTSGTSGVWDSASSLPLAFPSWEMSSLTRRDDGTASAEPPLSVQATGLSDSRALAGCTDMLH